MSYGSYPLFGNPAAPGQLPGTATNDNAAAGNVGEYISASQSTGTNAPGSTATFANLVSISLTAGDWDVSSIVTWSLNGATCTFVRSTISIVGPTSGGTQGDTVADGVPPTANYNTTLVIPAARISLAATTTVYLNGAATYSAGNPQFRCRLSARRVR